MLSDRINDILVRTIDREASPPAVHTALVELMALKASGEVPAAEVVASIEHALTARAAAGTLERAVSTAMIARIAGMPQEPRNQLLRLQDIVRAASAHAPMSERLPRVTHLVAAAMGMDACTIFVRDELTNVLVLSAAHGMDPSTVGAVTLQIGRGIVGQAAKRQETISATNALEHASYLNHPGLTDDLFYSQLSTPLVVEDQHRLVGVISVHTIEPRDFADDEIEFLETVAGVLAVSIDSSRQSARTDDQLQQKVAELATLQRVSRVVASSLDLTEVLKLITEQAVELIQAEAASIFRRSEDRPLHANPMPTIEYRIGKVRQHENAAARDAIVVDVLDTGVARVRDLAYADGLYSIFCLPLNTARETLGALCFRLRHGTRLEEDKLGLLQAFGDAAAIAIDNARLYQEAVTSVQTKSALVQEMHHRVRNNLQTVAALLSLQLRSDPDAPWTFELGEAVSRIQSIAGVHDLMSDESRLAGTTVDVLAKMVAEEAHSTLTPPGLTVEYVIKPTTLRVPSRQATIIALLINELTANAIHHGFRDRDRGRVTIAAREEDGKAVIEVANDGAKIPEGFDPADSDGLGMRITQRLVSSDLRGEFTIEPTEEGTLATIRFPIVDLAAEDQSPGDG